MEAKQCNSLSEVRTEIDKLDSQIVELIAKRNAYIHQAAKFKVSIEEVKDESRVSDVLSRARNQAMELGVNPSMMSEIFELMINKMVDAEIAEFQDAKNL
ncbi:MAG: chorismate mutase [Thiovulaceae bacterium]|nr:chorismate mutase [Sulfurimonadaceae bacterium]